MSKCKALVDPGVCLSICLSSFLHFVIPKKHGTACKNSTAIACLIARYLYNQVCYCQMSDLKCTKFNYGWGPYSVPPDLFVGY